jgi:hypothetical protein
MNSDVVVLVFIVALSIAVVANVVLASRVVIRRESGVSGSFARDMIADSASKLVSRISELENELERSKRMCSDEIKMLTDRVDFLIGVISGNERVASWSEPRRANEKIERVAVIGNRSVYASAIKMSGVTVSIIETDDVITSLAMMPHVSADSKFRVIVIVVDNWDSVTDERLSIIGDIGSKSFVLIGRGSDRVALYLSRHSAGVVAVNGGAASPVGHVGGHTSPENVVVYDSVTEGNIAAFCASLVSMCVKGGISLERAYRDALPQASEWVSERARFYGKTS